MRDGYKFEFGALDEPDAPKVQALKPLEEAAEVYGAWQDCDDMRLSPIMTARRVYRQNLIDECMDVVQAVVSLLDAEGFTQEDVDAAIERCNERNRERTSVMETLEQIKADAVEVFHFDRECRPQDRAHAYLGKYRVRRSYNDTAMQVAVTDMIERAYEAGRAGIADANLVQNLRRQLTSIEATVGDAIDLLDESVGGRTAMSDSRVGGYPMGVTDAAIERHFGGACEPRMCGNCRHFCGSDIHADYGYCHLEFERAYDAEAPDRKEGFWRLAKWAVAWLMGNLLYCEDECGECRDYEEFGL